MTRLKVSGAAPGLMLAIVVLGGGPAALTGLVVLVVRWLVSWPRRPVHYLRNDASKLRVAAVGDGIRTQRGHPRHPPEPLGARLLPAGVRRVPVGARPALPVDHRVPVLRRARAIGRSRARGVLPLLSAQLFSGLLTMVAVYVVVRLGTAGLARHRRSMIVIFQYLVGELLTSKHRGDRLAPIATTDELTGLANRERFRARLEQEITLRGRRRRQLRGDAARPRPLQGDQRHARPPLRGSAAARARAAAGRARSGRDGLVARLGGDEFAVSAGRADRRSRAPAPDRDRA